MLEERPRVELQADSFGSQSRSSASQAAPISAPVPSNASAAYLPPGITLRCGLPLSTSPSATCDAGVVAALRGLASRVGSSRLMPKRSRPIRLLVPSRARRSPSRIADGGPVGAGVAQVGDVDRRAIDDRDFHGGLLGLRRRHSCIARGAASLTGLAVPSDRACSFAIRWASSRTWRGMHA